ncbi:MMPL family transporter [Streptomyces sp. NPDC054854]
MSSALPEVPPAAPPVPDGEAPSRLARTGAFCARHPLWVMAAWLLVMCAALAGRQLVGAGYSDQVSLPGTATHAGASLLNASEPAAGAPSGKVVLHVDSGTVADHGGAVSDTIARLAALPHVTAASPPVTSADSRTAYSVVSFDAPLKSLGHAYTDELDEATEPARAAGVGVGYGGDLDQIVRPPADDVAAELTGLAAALVILLLAFGSVAAALLSIATALIGVGVGMGVVGVVAGAVAFATAAPTLAAMLGLGVGIDYALFLTTRYRQDLMEGRDPIEAAGRTAATSGHAVLVAALTVGVALLGLYACGIGFIGKLGLAATIAVVMTAAAAVTLVPAALGLVGRRIDRVHVRRPVAETSGDRDGWHRYAARVARRPWTFLLAGTALLALCAVPMFSMRLGHVDSGSDPVGSSTRDAHTWISDAEGPGFGPGANGPLLVVVDLRDASRGAADIGRALGEALEGTPGVARATPPRASADGRILISTVTPATGPQEAATGALFDRLGDRTLPQALADTGATAHLTGTTAGQLDFRDTVTRRLPLIIGLVLVASFLLLMTVFRSLVIPLKAVLLNLATTAASYGVLVAVFQWGWGAGLLGLTGPVPIESYVPMMMFAITFGLSMDYEIFLLSRIAEDWRALKDNQHAVGTGLAVTGRVISSAALIMTVVFLSFAASPTVVIKMLALGLAVSVIIDATVVRLVMVPSFMFLAGRANWWLPRGLDRILPHIRA